MVTYFGARRVFTARGTADRLIKRMLVEGEILAGTAALLETERDKIETAYSLDGGTAVLLDNDSKTTYQMDNCRVLELAWLQEEAKAHFATALPFRVTLESEEIAAGGLLSFSESVTRIGNGGPRVVWPELQNGPSEPQITAAATNVTLIQSGEAVAVGSYPAGNQPLFGPPNLDNATDTTSRSAQFADIRTVFTTRWNYVMTFNAAVALPFPIVR